jgi:hypothetical protein
MLENVTDTEQEQRSLGDKRNLIDSNAIIMCNRGRGEYNAALRKT